jgi:hypothetical protein
METYSSFSYKQKRPSMASSWSFLLRRQTRSLINLISAETLRMHGLFSVLVLTETGGTRGAQPPPWLGFYEELVQMPVRCHGKKNHVHTDTYISPVFSLMACCYVHGFSNSFSDCPLFSTLKYIFSTTIAKLPNFVVPGSPTLPFAPSLLSCLDSAHLGQIIAFLNGRLRPSSFF